MSKKLDAIKEAVFYSQQKPEKLASILESNVTDVVTEVLLSGTASIEVPTGDTANTGTYTATVISQYGDVMEGQSVTYALVEAVTGVTISGSIVSVAKTAVAESFGVKATCGTKTATMTVALVPAN